MAVAIWDTRGASIGLGQVRSPLDRLFHRASGKFPLRIASDVATVAASCCQPRRWPAVTPPPGRREAYENHWCISLFGETCWPPEVSSRLSEIVSVLPQDFSGLFLIRLADCIFRSRLETERDARFAARADPRNLPYFVHAGSGKCCRPCGCA